ncbi:MAG TPA: Rrf2 family transcriptional regulator [Candidatus Hydrogenedentes bacterium]|nr:Rrf2 family transcriptional regulator [Candidatus Hydrogenedentota bacterium]HRK33447.1 Rrf2 family transcriptional regulator [Candidatus Hydrogenedentota bacterium]
MNISGRCEYACRAVVELAAREHENVPVTAQYIAEQRGIPEKYLVHILLQLKRAGIVRSLRGSQGGYLLGRTPDEISLLDIVRAIDGGVLDPLPVDDAHGNDIRPAWKQAAKGIEDVLRLITVRELASGAHSSMYYI